METVRSILKAEKIPGSGLRVKKREIRFELWVSINGEMQILASVYDYKCSEYRNAASLLNAYHQVGCTCPYWIYKVIKPVYTW